ncbi:MAG: 2-dehydro-3-deoxygalactonokinase [Singulisphaera sp.]
MDGTPAEWSVALDGGTTNTRARLIHGDRIVATARRAVGVRDAVFDSDSRSLAVAVRAAMEEVSRGLGDVRPDLIVAAGMLSSEVGLTAVPHVEAPAGIDALARGGRSPAPRDRRPADRLRAGRPHPPRRGRRLGRGRRDAREECETVGSWTHLAARSPGRPRRVGSRRGLPLAGLSYKLVAVDAGGRILQPHHAGRRDDRGGWRGTRCSRPASRDLPDEPDRAALDAGARLATREGLGRAAFLVRIAALAETLGPEARASFWLGAVVADDVAHLSRHPMLDGPVPVRVGGRQPLRSLYARWLGERHAGPVSALDDDLAERASALGALAIARRRLELQQNLDSSPEPVRPR